MKRLFNNLRYNSTKRTSFSILLTTLILITSLSLSKAQTLDSEVYTGRGAFSYSISDKTVIGIEQTYTIKGKETLLEIARYFGLGYNEIVEANPHIDPWIPPEGQKIRIPTIWILPKTKDEGIVINLAEMRLYYFFKAGKGYPMVRTFPIGIGREGLNTPLGVYSITSKVRNPTWYPPKFAREEDTSLPPYIPPGPDNPLGGHWLQLSVSGYGIHGTNKPWGIGRKVSRGCIRLYPEDILWLFEKVKIKTHVEITNQPVKIGYKGDRLYIEVHKNERDVLELYKETISKIKMIRGPFRISTKDLLKAINEASGIPILISK